MRRDSNKRREDEYMKPVHRRISKHRNVIWQRRNQHRVRVAAGRVLNEVHAALYEDEWRWERFYPV